jgi:hypothetical protein
MKNIPFPVPGMGWERGFFVLNICVNEMGEERMPGCISTVEVIKISLCSVSPFQKRRRKKYNLQ